MSETQGRKPAAQSDAAQSHAVEPTANVAPRTDWSAPAHERVAAEQGPARWQRMQSERAQLGAALARRFPIQRRALGPALANLGVQPQTPSTGGGAALPEATREKMERGYGHDFSGVRVHQGGQAGALGAAAYARGNELHFGPGRYDPKSASGEELIAHELAHVVQQREGRASTAQGKGSPVVDDPALEAEADRRAAEVVKGGAIAPARSRAPSGGRAAAQLRKLTGNEGGQLRWSDTHNCWWYKIGQDDQNHTSVFFTFESDRLKQPDVTKIEFTEFHVTLHGKHYFFDENGKFLPGGSQMSFIFRGCNECEDDAQDEADKFVRRTGGTIVRPPPPQPRPQQPRTNTEKKNETTGTPPVGSLAWTLLVAQGKIKPNETGDQKKKKRNRTNNKKKKRTISERQQEEKNAPQMKVDVEGEEEDGGTDPDLKRHKPNDDKGPGGGNNDPPPPPTGGTIEVG